MRDKQLNDLIESIHAQYDKFPYPVGSIWQEDPERNLRPSFNIDLGLSGRNRLYPGSKAWVPGCATRWAVMLALQFRDVEILATDLCEKHLAIQQDIANGLGITNIHFLQEDLLTSRYRFEFDFISCVGVLHHLPEPEIGFKILRNALKPTGLAEIMVYDRTNRQHSIRMRQIIDLFDPKHEMSAAKRFDLCITILTSFGKNNSAPQGIGWLLTRLKSDPVFEREVADVLTNPVEHYFDVPSLMNALSRSGLQPLCWRPRQKFDPASMLSSETLKNAISRMSQTQTIHLAHLLSSSPLELFVVRSDYQPASKLGFDTRSSVRSMEYAFQYDNLEEGSFDHVLKPKLFSTESNFLFDSGQRRPAVADYGREPDCRKPGKRTLLQIPLSFDGHQLSKQHIVAILNLAQEPITVSEIAHLIATDKSLPQVSSRAIEHCCERLCTSPYRLLATMSEDS